MDELSAKTREFLLALPDEHNHLNIGPFDRDAIIQSPVTKYLECKTCHGMPRVGVMHPCGHLYCVYCYKVEAQNSSTTDCGLCKTINFMRLESHRFAGPIWADMRVRCKQCGSDDTYSPSALIDHETKQCPKRIIRCPGLWCSERFEADQTENHIKSCRSIRWLCGKCLVPMNREEVEEHDCVKKLQEFTRLFRNDCNYSMAYQDSLLDPPSKRTMILKHQSRTPRSLADVYFDLMHGFEFSCETKPLGQNEVVQAIRNGARILAKASITENLTKSGV